MWWSGSTKYRLWCRYQGALLMMPCERMAMGSSGLSAQTSQCSMLPKEAGYLLVLCELTIAGRLPFLWYPRLPDEWFANLNLCDGLRIHAPCSCSSVVTQSPACQKLPVPSERSEQYLSLLPTCRESISDATCPKHQGLGWPDLFLARLSYSTTKYGV